MEILEAIKELRLKERIKEMQLVGSAYILGEEKAKDLDYLILLSEEEYNTLDLLAIENQGYEISGDACSGPKDDRFLSIKKGDLNIIFCGSAEFYAQWLLAAEVCKALKLEEKEARVMVHCILMDGAKASDFNYYPIKEN